MGPSARAYASYLLRDDERVYAAAAEQHEAQAAAFPRFKEAVRDFVASQAALKAPNRAGELPVTGANGCIAD